MTEDRERRLKDLELRESVAFWRVVSGMIDFDGYRRITKLQEKERQQIEIDSVELVKVEE